MLLQLLKLRRFHNVAILISCLFIIFLLLHFLHLPFKSGKVTLPDKLLPDISTIAIGKRSLSERIDRGIQCMKQMRYNPAVHPKAPVHFLPQGSAMLSPITAYATVCSETRENLKLILVLNRVGSAEIRNAMRQTFGKFDELNLKSNWSLLFLVSALHLEEISHQKY